MRPIHRLVLARAFVSSLVATIGAVGCSSAPVEGPAGSTSESIIDGTPVTNDTLGEVYVCNGYNASHNTCSYICSGTMIADRWMLTAHHCATFPPVQSGGTATPTDQMFVGYPGGVTYYNTGVYLHPTLDIALVHTDYSVVNSAGAVVTTPMWTGTSASLVNQTLLCEGFGYTTPSGAGWGWGNLTSAMLTVSAVSGSVVTVDQNAQGQTDYEGDSGGACFLPSINQVVTVHSSQNSPEGFTPQTTNDVGVDAIYPWAEGIIETDGSCTPKTQNAACIVTPPSDFPLYHHCGASVNQPDGCGGSYDCGACAKGHPCVDGLCSLSY